MGWDWSRRYEGCDEADGLQGPTAGDGSRCESQSWDNTRSPPRGEGTGVHTRSTAHVHGPPRDQRHQQATEEGSVTRLFGEAIRFLHRK
ncbi:unnamed protein product [Gadus morhua 'NCC']